jgi:6-phosphofructokinase 1
MSEEKGRLGIVVGGGPAPGINGVISAAAIEAINEGVKVIGIYDGFRWLVQGDISRIIELGIKDVSRIHWTGGSILRTSRENPTKNPEKLRRVIESLEQLKIKYLLTIGGDDTSYTAVRIEEVAKGAVQVAHVPKTIDNDLPLPDNDVTFGFQSARHVGVNLIESLMEDAKTTSRWYFIVTMGRRSGFLALGIGKAAGATLTLIAEEFKEEKISLSHLCDIIEGAIIKRKFLGHEHGVLIMSEGIGERLDQKELDGIESVERDEFDHPRLSEIDLGKIVKEEIKRRFANRGQKITIVEKDIGYELRSCPPIPFDLEYTRDLGHGAVRFLLSGGSGALITLRGGHLEPVPFDKIIDRQTGKVKVRMVDTTADSYQIALKYMIRLEKEDFENSETLQGLAKTAGLSVKEFRQRFEYLAI